MPNGKLILFGLLAWSGVAFSETSPAKLTATELETTQFALAKHWKLSEKEMVRFKEILQSPRAYFTPNLDKNPLLALALEAETEEERASYADRWVQLQYDNNVKVIAWQLEVDEAWKRQYPGIPRFAYKQPAFADQVIANQQKGGSFLTQLFNQKAEAPRAQLYITTKDCSACIRLYDQQLAALTAGKIAGVDLFFEPGTAKDEIVSWAVKHKVSADDVNTRKVITLNVAETAKNIPAIEFD
jgi:integrating conjugative element protein (TIGR03759 family)